MNIIKKIISFLENLFKKQNTKIKRIEKKVNNVEENNTVKFANSLKVNTTYENKENPPIETRICPGDGLGIKKGLSS